MSSSGRTTGVGDIHQALYQHPAAFRDVTSGSNYIYNAGPGFDQVTGLGSPLWDTLGPFLVPGYAAASPPPSATPSASPTTAGSPAPSATATPSVSPSATPSPSAVPEVAPSVFPEQSVISAGQRVAVQYQGQPGGVLTILSKTQPATAYSVIGSVTLDASGFGAASYAPTKNTRLEASTASGLFSGQPLIQVRSVASFNANRIRNRTYTFTGRVYPARDQRLVSVYRNGTLAAQGRCDANGIYSVTRTLAAGTYAFQARTASDTYNLGTTSRSVQVSIH